MNSVYVVPPELEHEQPCPGFGGPMQCSQVLSLNLSIVQEYVIEGAIDDGVEPIFEAIEACRIRYPEIDRHSGTLRVALGSVDRRWGAVNASCRITLRRVVDRVMARTRSRIEYLASQSTVCDQLLDHWLRAADVPWRQRGQAVD